MIEQCLQKNPADRPTAKQLLKHDFFKKAKDRSYIAKHLALKFQDRKKMEEKLVNRRKPQSIRAVRLSDSGEWKFSSGSDDEGTSGNDVTLGDEAANKLKKLVHQTGKNDGELPPNTEPINKPVGHAPHSISVCYTRGCFLQGPPPNDPPPQTNPTDVAAAVKESTTDSTQVLKLTLRIRSVDDEHTADKHTALASRNTQNDLHDIKFDFNKATETVHDVVSEMVSASLIDERDAQLGTSRFFHHRRRSSSFHSSLFFNDETRRKSSTCHSDICSRSFIAGIARTCIRLLSLA